MRIYQLEMMEDVCVLLTWHHRTFVRKRPYPSTGALLDAAAGRLSQLHGHKRNDEPLSKTKVSWGGQASTGSQEKALLPESQLLLAPAALEGRPFPRTSCAGVWACSELGRSFSCASDNGWHKRRMESSVPMIMGGRKASAFHIRTAGKKYCGRNQMGTLARCPIFFFCQW